MRNVEKQKKRKKIRETPSMMVGDDGVERERASGERNKSEKQI